VKLAKNSLALAALLSLASCAAPGSTAPGSLDGPGLSSSSSTHVCGRETDPATVRVVDVYRVVLARVLDHFDAKQPDRPVVYLVDHAVPGRASPTDAEERQGHATGVRSPSTAEIPVAVRDCLSRLGLPDRHPLRWVKGPDDPAIPRERPDGFSRIRDGRMILLAGVPPTGDRIEVLAWSIGGGGLDGYGTRYVLEGGGDTWRIVDHYGGGYA
jgi:hypothetical protein